jgi:hypothetical protein
VSLLVLDLDNPWPENDVEGEVNGVDGGYVDLCKGCTYNRFIKMLAKDLKSVRRVLWQFHRSVAVFEFHLITNTVLLIQII